MASVSRRQLLLGGAALALAGRARAAEPIVLSNARILVGDGTEVQGGVRVEDGFIEAVGPEVTGGVDLGGAVLWPGIYLAGAPLGLFEVDLEGGTHDEGEGKDAVVPLARVVDAYNPASALLPVARVGGILGALVTPTRGLVAGQAAWMRTFGDTVEEAAIVSPAPVCFGLGRAGTGLAGGPTSRMGVAMTLRELFDANPLPEPPPVETKRKKRGEAPAPPPPTRTQQVFHALRRRATKAIFAAERASDVEVALDLVEEFGLDGMILGGAEAHACAARLARMQVPVLLGPVTVQPSSFDTLRATYANAALLHAAGVRFAFRVGGPHNARDVATEAGIAVAYGLPWNTAIAALTGNGPSFWKLPVGRIARGMEASFVLSDGDPLQPRTRVLRLWGKGKELPVQSRQTELYERFRTLR